MTLRPLFLNALLAALLLAPPALAGWELDPERSRVSARVVEERLERLAVGESLVETLRLRVQSGNQVREEPLAVRFTKEATGRVRIANAERVALDGQALMADPTLRSVLLLLGYERIGDEVPVSLDAVLVHP